MEVTPYHQVFSTYNRTARETFLLGSRPYSPVSQSKRCLRARLLSTTKGEGIVSDPTNSIPIKIKGEGNYLSHEVFYCNYNTAQLEALLYSAFDDFCDSYTSASKGWHFTKFYMQDIY